MKGPKIAVEEAVCRPNSRMKAKMCMREKNRKKEREKLAMNHLAEVCRIGWKKNHILHTFISFF